MVEMNVSFQRCGIESKIIVQGASVGTVHPRSVLAIQNFLHLALKWNGELISGNAISMKALAQQHGVTQRYLSELLKLEASPGILLWTIALFVLTLIILLFK